MKYHTNQRKWTKKAYRKDGADTAISHQSTRIDENRRKYILSIIPWFINGICPATPFSTFSARFFSFVVRYVHTLERGEWAPRGEGGGGGPPFSCVTAPRKTVPGGFRRLFYSRHHLQKFSRRHLACANACAVCLSAQCVDEQRHSFFFLTLTTFRARTPPPPRASFLSACAIGQVGAGLRPRLAPDDEIHTRALSMLVEARLKENPRFLERPQLQDQDQERGFCLLHHAAVFGNVSKVYSSYDFVFM